METYILKDIVFIFALSTLVNLLFTKIKVPTIIGYMFTGILAGPHMFKIIDQPHNIDTMAEIGVILLMFTIGLEFSLNHLFRIRKIVFVGGFIQLFITAGITVFLARYYKMAWNGAVFIGFISALSSTAIVLKLLQDRSEITSNHGRTILGILIFQDIIVVPMLLFTPFLAGEQAEISKLLLILGAKAIFIVGIVYVSNRWVMHKFLFRIALTKNPELFLMCILLICLSFALLTYQLGMSLAIGAFLGGLMISETEYNHNAFGYIMPFKDTFTSFFFVSIGMMLDVTFIREHYTIVILTVSLLLLTKFLIAGGTGFILGHSFRNTIFIGIALSQVGEFSFIVAKTGLDFNIISSYYYQLFLATAIITMSLTPFLYKMAIPIANNLLKLPLPGRIKEGMFPLQQIELPDLSNHMVIIGKDSRSQNLAIMAQHNNLPYISIVFEPSIAQDRMKKGEPVLYGDAVNEPVLLKAHINTAEIAVISVGDLITAMAITEKIRNINKHVYIIARTKHVSDIEQLYKYGANEVIPEEFETAIDVFERVLGKLLLPDNEIHKAVSRIRDDHYGIFRDKPKKKKATLIKELPNIEISAFSVHEGTVAVKETLSQLNFNENFGVSAVAIKRGEILIDHPGSETVINKGDIIYLLGTPTNIAIVFEYLSRKK